MATLPTSANRPTVDQTHPGDSPRVVVVEFAHTVIWLVVEASVVYLLGAGVMRRRGLARGYP